jgi:CPA1 family monovalent cation:H+ antiporter
MLGAVLLSCLINQRFPSISTPLVQIALGVGIAFLPFVHIDTSLDPELFLVVFIAPLLFDDAKNTDKATLWRLRRPVLLLAIGLVVVTCLVAGAISYLYIATVPLAAALALSAALAPTDAVAVGSIQENATISSDQKALLKGESLFNDASSIVAFQFALAWMAIGPYAFAAGSGPLNFSLTLVWTFILMFAGGVAVGVGYMLVRYLLINFLRKRGLDSVVFYVLLEILHPFLVYLLAEVLHVSGIIAVVTAGIVYSLTQNNKSPAQARHNIVSTSAWSLISYVLNGFVFLLLGTQLPGIISRAAGLLPGDGWLAWPGMLLAVVVVLAAVWLCRFVWILVMRRAAVKAERDKQAQSQSDQVDHAKARSLGALRLKDALILTLTGVKGTITLSLLFTIPWTLTDGSPFPDRAVILLIAAGVIICSLLIANFVVPLISPRAHDPELDVDEVEAIATIYHKVIERLSIPNGDFDRTAVAAVISQYNHRIRTLHKEHGIDNSSEREIRKLVIGWSTQHTQKLVAQNKVGPVVGAVYINQLGRMLQAVEHHGNLLWRWHNIWRQLSRRRRISRKVRKRTAAEAAAGQIGEQTQLFRQVEQDMDKQEFAAKLRELQHENFRYALSKLDTLMDERPQDIQAINRTMAEFRRRTKRLSGDERGAVGGTLQSVREVGHAEAKRRVEMRAMRYEREEIEQALIHGKISRATARSMRDNLAMMELDIESQLD